MKNNIILIGMPGSGKTTHGKPLAEKLGYRFLDFDDDVIKVEMGKGVSDCLAEMGEEAFLDMEEKLALNLTLNNTLLSASGSLPLSQRAMDHLRQQGYSICLDIPLETIKGRLHRMKTRRIVGMGDMTLDEILAYRKKFYDIAYDFKFDHDGIAPKQEISAQFLDWFENNVSPILD